MFSYVNITVSCVKLTSRNEYIRHKNRVSSQHVCSLLIQSCTEHAFLKTNFHHVDPAYVNKVNNIVLGRLH